MDNNQQKRKEKRSEMKSYFVRTIIIIASIIGLFLLLWSFYYWIYCVKLTVHIDLKKNDVCEFVAIFTCKPDDEFIVKDAFKLFNGKKIKEKDLNNLINQTRFATHTFIYPYKRYDKTFSKRLSPGFKVIRVKTENCGDYWEQGFQLEKDSEIYLSQKDKYDD